MKKMLKVTALAVLFCVAIASCVDAGMNGFGNKLEPSTNVVTEQYQQAAFDAVKLNAVADVQIVQSNESKVVLTAPENYIDLFHLTNKDGKLTVSFGKKKVSIFTKNVHITIYTPHLRQLENGGVSSVNMQSLDTESMGIYNSGVGNLKIQKLKAHSVDVECSGVGNVSVAGEAEVTSLKCSGVGNIHAGDLVGKIVEANVTGVGSIECQALESIKGGVSGVGSLKYKGHPKDRDVHRKGVGSVSEL